ncbi:hypothetical protein EQM14_13955 [Caproiciproducens sp. NJN-50]|uniref:hypothetical protein n=1 Tax=Acutalibacteraceae TaxID=3082771 RepID=UPI000FFE2A79|nr:MULTISPECIES: hypothetical protein [Acutalibacteraceae]QAT50779.1 hypothetical protein EQM14_13955 [Caproiciproducens sp. NJN-50]
MAWEIPGTVLPNQTANFHRSVRQAEGCGDTPPAGETDVCEKKLWKKQFNPYRTRRARSVLPAKQGAERLT